ncbi:MAG: VanW family protein [Christensenellales bacterium]|jgi:vancomycin resistance protein YoaR
MDRDNTNGNGHGIDQVKSQQVDKSPDQERAARGEGRTAEEVSRQNFVLVDASETGGDEGEPSYGEPAPSKPFEAKGSKDEDAVGEPETAEAAEVKPAVKDEADAEFDGAFFHSGSGEFLDDKIRSGQLEQDDTSADVQDESEPESYDEPEVYDEPKVYGEPEPQEEFPFQAYEPVLEESEASEDIFVSLEPEQAEAASDERFEAPLDEETPEDEPEVSGWTAPAKEVPLEEEIRPAAPRKAPRKSVRAQSGKKSRKGLWITLTILILLALAAAAYFGVNFYLEYKARIAAEDALLAQIEFFDGSKVDGIDLSGKTIEEAKRLVEGQWSRKLDGSITLTAGENEYELVWNKLHIKNNADEVLQSVYAIGRTGERKEKLAAVENLALERPDHETSLSYNDEVLASLVEEIAEALYQEAQEPYAEMDETAPLDAMFTYVEGKNGYELDQQALIERLKERIEQKDFESDLADLPVTVVETEYTVEDVKHNTQLISSAYTTYAHNPNRNHNIMLSTKSINGTVLAPGEEFSFNGTTGNTTNGSLGYKVAGVIENGVASTAYGGGICQTSTTLYNAVFRAGLEITNRRNHSIPSAYCPIGHDATVSYGSVDFKFRNNTDHNIYIRGVTTADRVTFYVYGRPLPDGQTITMESVITGSFGPPAPKVTVDPNMEPGKQETKVTALTGQHVDVYKVVKDKDGKVISRTLDHKDTYPARQAQIVKGPDKPAETPAPSPSPKPSPSPSPDPSPPPADEDGDE